LPVNSCHITSNEAIASGGTASGGIYSLGNTFVVNDTTASNNRVIIANSQTIGGGIFASTPQTIINNLTVSGNTVTNSNGVSSDRHGGGIYNLDLLTIRNSTVTDNGAVGSNSGSGIYSSFSVTVGNTIVAGNRNNSTIRDVNADVSNSNRFTSQGYNLIGSAPTGIGFTNGVNNDRVGSAASQLDPGLNMLGNYGGTTPTHSLQSNSPVIDKGKNFGSTADQRGSARPFDFAVIANALDGDGTDIGAFELQSTPTAATVLIGGRILTSEGNGLQNARVTLTDQNGNSQTLITGKLGYFRFNNVAAGETYIISIASKHYIFQPRVIIAMEDVTNLNFTGIRRSGQTEIPIIIN
jgi:hypothetical protein